MSRSISMANGVEVATQASRDIQAWLQQLPQTQSVENVEAQFGYQQLDIDLIWTTETQTYHVEIKGDRWHETGNFFFETYSNFEKNTPGCFLYTQADLLFYYFVIPQHLYILPMPTTRQWFNRDTARFEERATTTPVGNQHYTTVGRLVPIAQVVAEVSGVYQHHLAPT